MAGRDIHVHLDVRISPRILAGALTAVLLLAFVGELGSETVNLTTYYPAPSGVYAQLMTTQNTYLSRTAVNTVQVGFATTKATSKLAINGDGSGLTIGGTNAASDYNAFGGGNNPVVAPVNGLLVQGPAGAGDGAVAIGATQPTAVPGNLQTGPNERPWVHINGDLRVGPGTGAKGRRGYVYVNASGCTQNTYLTGGFICVAGQYATFVPGLYVEGSVDFGRGGLVRAYYGGGVNDYTSQVWGLNTATGNPTWLTLAKNDTPITVWCCDK